MHGHPRIALRVPPDPLEPRELRADLMVQIVDDITLVEANDGLLPLRRDLRLPLLFVRARAVAVVVRLAVPLVL